MRFILFAEGGTEAGALGQFLKRWLDPQLSAPVGMRVENFGGWSKLVRGASDRASQYLLSGDSKEIIAIIGLLDLKGPTFFPSSAISTHDKVEYGKKYMNDLVGSPKYRQFFAVHDIEAWLLCDPKCLPERIREPATKYSGDPESVNNTHPPSQVLEQLYKTHLQCHYNKRRDGLSAFRKVDPSIAYEKCPHL